LGAINDLRNDPLVEVVVVDSELFQRALTLFGQRNDKDWGLTDCISFVLMQERGLTEALTTDSHFSQAGFRRLL
jgi:predicted nucleic acid-binding protein